MIKNSRDYFCIFGGGGIRGLSYVGAISVLEEFNINIKGCAGSSVGSIFAALLGVGYSALELKEAFFDFSPEIFRDINFSFGRDMGLSKGDLYEAWVRELIEQKFYGDQYKKGEMNPVRFRDIDFDIVIPSVNLTDSAFSEFSRYSTPDFEIAQAVRISSSMPGLFKPVEINNQIFIDGDIMKSWPIWRLSKNLCPDGSRILEFRLEDCTENKKIDNSFEYLNYVYNAATAFATDFVINLYGKKDKFDYIKLNLENVSVVDFLMSKEKKEKAIQVGYDITFDYFKNVLPKKKRNLLDEYGIISNAIHTLKKAVDKNNWEEANHLLGELFICLCERQFDIDSKICKKILHFKTVFKDNFSLSHNLFGVRKFKIKNQNLVKLQLSELDSILQDKLVELKDFIN